MCHLIDSEDLASSSFAFPTLQTTTDLDASPHQTRALLDNSRRHHSNMPPGGSSSRQQAAKDVIDVLNEISTILVRPPRRRSTLTAAYTVQHTGLDRTTLSLCVSLIENGVNPEALAVSAPRSSHLHRSLTADRPSSKSSEERRRPSTSLWAAEHRSAVRVVLARSFRSYEGFSCWTRLRTRKEYHSSTYNLCVLKHLKQAKRQTSRENKNKR